MSMLTRCLFSIHKTTLLALAYRKINNVTYWHYQGNKQTKTNFKKLPGLGIEETFLRHQTSFACHLLSLSQFQGVLWAVRKIERISNILWLHEFTIQNYNWIELQKIIRIKELRSTSEGSHRSKLTGARICSRESRSLSVAVWGSLMVSKSTVIP